MTSLISQISVVDGFNLYSYIYTIPYIDQLISFFLVFILYGLGLRTILGEFTDSLPDEEYPLD